ncbi:response regulator transcription factor [Pseudorhodoferax sp.]|uniref:response regulator transcription factor n=1 Tax=Pseudorhodoferax sp. TaxID=1993553 RepID=UPI0039E32B37
MRALVVEDDAGIAQGLSAILGQNGWAVEWAPGLSQAWTALRAAPFHAVLLDLGLPGGDGSSLLKQLRLSPAGRLPDPATPVLVMTARDQLPARIEALDLGADDYLIKPFDGLELAARMRAVCRRAAGRPQPVLRYGRLELEPARRQVRIGGEPVDLSAREFGVLLALLEASPGVLSRQQIEARLYRWDQVLESNAIEVYVHHLRRKLGEGLIHTVRGVGYCVPQDTGP